MKTRIIASLKADYPLPMLLSIAGLPRSTFFYHQKRLDRGDDRYAKIKERITTIAEKSRLRYGHRRVRAELVKAGVYVSKKTVLRLMRELGVLSPVRKKKFNSHRGQVGAIAENILKRDFTAAAPNQKWVTDVTEFAVADKKLYLSPIIDLFDRGVLSYTMSTSPNTQLTNESLQHACQGLRPGQTPLVHTDQGFQYQHVSWAAILADHGGQASMSRRGNCWDNAIAENFFGQLKSEMFYLESFTSVEQLMSEIDDYIHWYNYERSTSRLGDLAPMEYRLKVAKTGETVGQLC